MELLIVKFAFSGSTQHQDALDLIHCRQMLTGMTALLAGVVERPVSQDPEAAEFGRSVPRQS